MSMSTFVGARPYSLFILDLPRGLSLEAMSRAYDTRFDAQQLEFIITQFVALIHAEVYRIVMFHSVDDVSIVRSVLSTVWHKVFGTK